METKTELIEKEIINLFKNKQAEPYEVLLILGKLLASFSVLFSYEKEKVIYIFSEIFNEYEEVANKMPKINEFWNLLKEK